MLIQTERGLINVEAEYQSAERATMDGYSYSFHSDQLGKDVYSISLDKEGRHHSFALIVGFC